MSWYGYLELLITRHILSSPLKFKVSRVDCICVTVYMWLVTVLRLDFKPIKMIWFVLIYSPPSILCQNPPQGHNESSRPLPPPRRYQYSWGRQGNLYRAERHWNPPSLFSGSCETPTPEGIQYVTETSTNLPRCAVVKTWNRQNSSCLWQIEQNTEIEGTKV